MPALPGPAALHSHWEINHASFEVKSHQSEVCIHWLTASLSKKDEFSQHTTNQFFSSWINLFIAKCFSFFVLFIYLFGNENRNIVSQVVTGWNKKQKNDYLLVTPMKEILQIFTWQSTMTPHSPITNWWPLSVCIWQPSDSIWEMQGIKVAWIWRTRAYLMFGGTV